MGFTVAQVITQVIKLWCLLLCGGWAHCLQQLSTVHYLRSTAFYTDRCHFISLPFPNITAESLSAFALYKYM